MVGHHLEHREVLACLPDVVDIEEPHARLGERERVRGRAGLAADHPRLERIDARLHEEDVVPPPGDDRIALHPRVAVLLQVGEEVLAHRAVCELLRERRIPDEVVLLARGLAARLVLTDRPEGLAALRARLAGESLFAEELDLVFTLSHSRDRWARGL